ncbi:MAG: hypothetical protein QW774_01445 [Candidatus Micrarchaeaceae archaeon]
MPGQKGKGFTERDYRAAAIDQRRFIHETKPSLDKLLNELESHVYGTAIITFVGAREKEGHIWDAHRQGPNVFFGAEPQQWPAFYITFLDAAIKNDGTLVIILRSFLDKRDDITKLPIKELRGYIVDFDLNSGNLNYIQVSARKLAESESIDSVTGKAMQPEPSVVYCGPDGDTLNDSFIEIDGKML